MSNEQKMTSEQEDLSLPALIRWLDRKYSRHGELEDKYAADALRELAALKQPVEGEPNKYYGNHISEYWADWSRSTIATPQARVDTLESELTAAREQAVGNVVDAMKKSLSDKLRIYNRWRRGDKKLKRPDPVKLGKLIDDVADRLELLERENQQHFDNWHKERWLRESMAAELDGCLKMLLSESNTKKALDKTKNILRDMICKNRPF